MKRVRIKQRHIYQHILMLCEGDTEYIYLNGLKQSLGRDRQRGIKIEIETFKKHDGLSLIKEAVKRVIKARKEGNPYTSIWAVFDHDNGANIREAIDLSMKKGINIGYSKISIEVWFILHFRRTAQVFPNGEAAETFLRTNHLNTYHKTKTDHFTTLKTALPTAIVNATWLRQQKQFELDGGTGLHEIDPYTTMDELILFIQGI